MIPEACCCPSCGKLFQVMLDDDEDRVQCLCGCIFDPYRSHDVLKPASAQRSDVVGEDDILIE